MAIFRQQALDYQRQRLTGDVSLAQPLSITTISVLLSLFSCLVILFLLTAEYSRKETVRGFLMPSKGVIKAFAPNGGTIETILVREGDFVHKGQPIANLIAHQKNAQGVDLSAEIIQFLQSQISLIGGEIEQHKLLKEQELINLAQRKSALEEEKSVLTRQVNIAEQKLNLLQEQQQQFNHLNRQGFLSKLDNEQQKRTLLSALQETENIKRQVLQHETALAEVEFNASNLPQQYQLKISLLIRQKAGLEQQLAQINNNFKYTVIASHSGTITGIKIVEGETLHNIKPLMNILPEGSELVAELLLPTRSAGLVEEGDNSRLRFDAFPYQRFGYMESTIVRVDKALIIPNEIPLPITLQEPVYRLRAKLSAQTMQAYGKQLNLKSGMLFEADIMLEQRRLIEWLLEPIYSLRGRIS